MVKENKKQNDQPQIAIVVWERKKKDDASYPPIVDVLSLRQVMKGDIDENGRTRCSMQYQGALWEGYIDSKHCKLSFTLFWLLYYLYQV